MRCAILLLSLVVLITVSEARNYQSKSLEQKLRSMLAKQIALNKRTGPPGGSGGNSGGNGDGNGGDGNGGNGGNGGGSTDNGNGPPGGNSEVGRTVTGDGKYMTGGGAGMTSDVYMPGDGTRMGGDMYHDSGKDGLCFTVHGIVYSILDAIDCMGYENGPFDGDMGGYTDGPMGGYTDGTMGGTTDGYTDGTMGGNTGGYNSRNSFLTKSLLRLLTSVKRRK